MHAYTDGETKQTFMALSHSQGTIPTNVITSMNMNISFPSLSPALRQGSVGQQARDALLLIMSLSASDPRVARHIADNTYFCPVSIQIHTHTLTLPDSKTSLSIIKPKTYNPLI